MSVDLSGIGQDQPIGFRAKRHSALVDVDKKSALEVLDYWEPIWQRHSLILDPDQGADLNSNYQKQGLKLSKHFKPYQGAYRS